MTDRRAPITVLPQYWADEGSRRRYVDNLFDGTAGDYDFVERLLGLGSGPWYRRQALVRAGLKPGMRVLANPIKINGQRLSQQAGPAAGADNEAILGKTRQAAAE